ncbi:MAG TPA: hypothetical protein VF494_10140 [Candidatus Limnocylindrales bacterium]
MSPDTNRIAVPTNGKRPHPAPKPATPPVAGEALPAPVIAPFTPTQLAVGFGILAAAIAVVARSLRRRSRSGRHGPFGRR